MQCTPQRAPLLVGQLAKTHFAVWLTKHVFLTSSGQQRGCPDTFKKANIIKQQQSCLEAASNHPKQHALHQSNPSPSMACVCSFRSQHLSRLQFRSEGL